MRTVLLGLLAGCTIGNGPLQPPAHPWQEPPAQGSTYNSRIVALRTTLGRAGIRLQAAGAEARIWTSTCELPAAIRDQVGCVRCELAGESEPIDDGVLDAIKTAFDRYPTTMLVATGMQSVALCKHIEYENLKVDHQTAGTADIYGHRMLLSVEAFENAAYDPTGQFTAEDIVHHELYHLLEWERMRDDFDDDPEWRLENPTAFEYGSKQTDATRPAGFVDAYATTNPVEDRASVFQYLMTRPDELCEIAKTDSIVRTKANIVWSRVAAIEPDRFLRARATCVDWIQTRPLHRRLEHDRKWLRPPLSL